MSEYNLEGGMGQPELIGGMKIVLEALDPVTGNNVPGVVISSVVISGAPTGSGEAGGNAGPFMLVPGPGSVI